MTFLPARYLAGQEHHVMVIDSKTGSPVSFAHVMLTNLNNYKKINYITDIDGRFPAAFSGAHQVEISCVGYQRFLDTLRSQEDLTLMLQPAILDIDEVVVTAQYKPEKVDKSIYNVKVINSMKIRQKAATNLTDLLNDELSIRLGQDGALGSSLSIRGLSGEHVKFLIDGVPVIGRMNGNIDPSQLNLNNVDHVEIIEGPMSVVYGSNALAGVVNIITRESRFNSLNAHTDAYYESVGVYNFSGGAMVRKGKHAFSLEGARNFFGGFSEEEGKRFQRWRPKRQLDLDAFYLYSYDGSRVKFNGKFFDEKLLNRGELLPPYYEYAFDNYFYTRRATGKMEYQSDFGGSGYFDMFIAYSTYSRIKETFLKDLTTLESVKTTNDEDQDTSAFHSVISRGSYSNFHRNLEYQMGWEVNAESGRGKRITDEKQQIGDYALYLTMKYNPLGNLSLQPGLRYGYNTRYTFPLVYSLSLKYDLTEHSAVRATYARGFRSPSLKELYLYFVDINHNIQGNEDLKAEYSDNLNASYNYSREKGKQSWGLELTAFYNDIENIITLAVLEGDLYTYINLEDYQTAGGQLSMNYRWYPGLSLKWGIAGTGRSSHTETADGERPPMRYSTDVTGNVVWKYMPADLELSLFYKYSGRLPQFYIDENDELTEGYIADYHTMDFSLSRTFFSSTLNLSAGVKNVFNNTSLEITTISSGGVHGSGGSHLAGWGRTFFLKASWMFNKILKHE